MVSKNLHVGIKNWYEPNQILIYDGYLKVGESLYARVTIWVNTILYHIVTMTILSRMKILAWYIDANDIENKNKFPQISIPYKV